MRRLARLEKKLGLVVRPKELYGGRLLDIQQETGPSPEAG
jgi:hypothetical protein